MRSIGYGASAGDAYRVGRALLDLPLARKNRELAMLFQRRRRGEMVLCHR